MASSRTDAVVLTWELAGADVEYLLDGATVGANDDGFRSVLQALGAGNIRKLVISRPAGGSLGGRLPEEDLPFYRFYDDLLRLAGDRNIVIEFISTGG